MNCEDENSDNVCRDVLSVNCGDVDSDEACWEVLSFFALPPDRQESLIGKGPCQWLEKDTELSEEGAYLMGLVRTLSETWQGFLDSFDLFESTRVKSLSCLFEDMFWNKPRNIWSLRALRDFPEWEEVRHLSKYVLSEAGLDLNPPSKPLHIEHFLEIESY
jgi:hypothetical protein